VDRPGRRGVRLRFLTFAAEWQRSLSKDAFERALDVVLRHVVGRNVFWARKSPGIAPRAFETQYWRTDAICQG